MQVFLLYSQERTVRWSFLYHRRLFAQDACILVKSLTQCLTHFAETPGPFLVIEPTTFVTARDQLLESIRNSSSQDTLPLFAQSAFFPEPVLSGVFLSEPKARALHRSQDTHSREERLSDWIDSIEPMKPPHPCSIHGFLQYRKDIYKTLFELSEKLKPSQKEAVMTYLRHKTDLDSQIALAGLEKHPMLPGPEKEAQISQQELEVFPNTRWISAPPEYTLFKEACLELG